MIFLEVFKPKILVTALVISNYSPELWCPGRTLNQLSLFAVRISPHIKMQIFWRSLMAQGVKDPLLLLWWLRLLQWLGFHPWPRTSTCLGHSQTNKQRVSEEQFSFTGRKEQHSRPCPRPSWLTFREQQIRLALFCSIDHTVPKLPHCPPLASRPVVCSPCFKHAAKHAKCYDLLPC